MEVSRIRILSTSEAPSIVKYIGWRQKADRKPSGTWRGRRERRASGTLISSEDCRILQMRIEDLQPGFDTPRPPMGAVDLWAAAAAAGPSRNGMSGERERPGRSSEHIK